MEFYSPDKELKDAFNAEIKDADYISALYKFCQKSDILYSEVQFFPHNLLTAWNEYVEIAQFGDDLDEEFHMDIRREILLEIENEKSFIKFSDHQTFLKILYSIDEKFKAVTFIPSELKNEEKWWHASIYKKGSMEYIENIEKYIYDRFGKKLSLKEQIELI
ncbi:hypothetical protein [Aequorivita viscosa]|uniref:Uncharacterized protein n=1 Tax=Aequorivita viscosa TaxID=797419 RepID=A0A1M6LTD2_9FLAO|nr:hypothetical protein [Aequorivita viscosa]SDX25766.1 hypothetical protein SAMN05216556_12223 [Aequorivita viscosa]SHJ74477.1 hypothetical protein SAMN04487908_12436 [Aequorivita viscosa]